ncbi:ankyrin repeat protein [Ophiostoma piceae UAMH 11346]|uniref:Ankyrin repeat protein n=1 Tax=Ophiostoma piceae (strain UAMH 11346) TaxID=1262450 RepID=S3C9Q6_OPHP1|nr:ankyrin repeat protein [Ophiostoma piceae UAMH 11346]
MQESDQTDASGNTLFHRAALSGFADDQMAALVERGTALHVDASQANLAGRTPLHVICSRGWNEHQSPWDAQHVRAQITALLPCTRNIEAAPLSGMRPLHLAAMLSETAVYTLLAAGADPTATTAEGMSPLHLAARARQSNILGLLVSALALRGQTAAVAARDAAGRQPLHLACRSGRPESVDVLLAAVKDLEEVPDASSLEAACAEFAGEQPLWDTYRRPEERDVDIFYMVGIPDEWFHDVLENCTGLHDTGRPWVAAGPQIRAQILEELASEDDAGDEDPEEYRRQMDELFSNAGGGIRSEQDTTQIEPILETLRQAYPSLGGSPPQPDAAQLAALVDASNASAHATENLFRSLVVVERLLRNHRHPAIPPLLHCWASTPPSTVLLAAGHPPYLPETEWVPKAVRRLVELGQANVLAAVWALDRDQPPLRPIFGPPEISGSDSAQPLLFLACARELPNMRVVRLLVETCAVDVNGRSMTSEQFEAARELPPSEWGSDEDPLPYATALHELARGRFWWGSTQAIPYLLAHGADVNAKDEQGRTPLDLAREEPIGTYQREVLALLEVS